MQKKASDKVLAKSTQKRIRKSNKIKKALFTFYAKDEGYKNEQKSNLIKPPSIEHS